MQLAKSTAAQSAWNIVQNLQTRFVTKLENISNELKPAVKFKKVNWLRDAGKFGGGYRYVDGDNKIYNRAAVNISQVHYENEPQKPLNSATAISTIIHPDNPLAPSVHMHYSFTELKNGTSYWRIMADLNPAIATQTDTDKFIAGLKNVASEHFATGIEQGDKYFSIPVLGRTRGVAHFYLEGFKTDKPENDSKFAEKFGKNMIDCYSEILLNSLQNKQIYTEQDQTTQLDYSHK